MKAQATMTRTLFADTLEEILENQQPTVKAEAPLSDLLTEVLEETTLPRELKNLNFMREEHERLLRDEPSFSDFIYEMSFPADAAQTCTEPKNTTVCGRCGIKATTVCDPVELPY